MAKFNPDEWEARINREIAEEEIRQQQERGGELDANFQQGMADILGMPLEEFQKALIDGAEGLDHRDVAKAAWDIKQAKKAARRGDHGKAKKIVQNSSAIKKTSKAVQKGKGCAVVVLALLGLAGLSIWGIAEVAGTLLG